MSSKTTASGGLLKLIFLAHLVLSSWGMMSPFFVPNSYIYYNVIYMIALMWAIGANNVDSIIMALLINTVIILMDAFALAFSWPRSGSSRERLYFGLAIANEALRPIAALLLYRVFKERDTENEGIRGVFADVLDGPNAQQRNGYQPLSTQNGQGQEGPSTSASYQATPNVAGEQNV